ncbi:unnamed protein product [Pseudo-nitzschia multistriata]|uniref:2-oxoisovalerate dehydrogenase subunit alpha n=1 Tax=Pseudo-nitzschia multistriata TaxID=183589 RepID=A0A448ZGL7_9STRA|nr:unnamed protein product [Pseudo-nitzschia multistriata]
MSTRTSSWIVATAARRGVAVGWCGFDRGGVRAAACTGVCLRSKSTRARSPRTNGETHLVGALNGIARRKRIAGGGEAPSRAKPQQPRKGLGPETVTKPIAVGSPAEATTVLAMEPEIQHSSDVNEFVSPSELFFAGDTPIPVTSRLHIVTPKEDTPRGTWPIFRIMDEDGSFRDGGNDGYMHDGDADNLVLGTSSPANKANGSNVMEPSASKNHAPGLSKLRDSLSKLYPNHSLAIEQNGLFQPSKFEYADTNSRDTLQRLLRHMVRLREMDSIFQNAQRQGRISFYLTCRGEEGIHFGTASALEPQDIILGQYREQGPLMWRGFTVQQFADQCFGNASDLGKGRQMPIHYGSRALNYQTISSCLGTQIPQAVGVALRLKMMAAADSEAKKAVSLAFFGDGCTSTTDFHSGLNFAATLECPVIFFCRNNGYAISTSTREQFAGDGIVSRAPGYGMAGIRVDGNDVFAVHAAVREARTYALENNAPVLIEAMSYRQGHHSTSDDSLQYRSAEEVDHFACQSDPFDRLRKFFERHEHCGVTDDAIQSVIEEEKRAVLDALRTAERKPKPPLEDLFNDVYHEMPPSLKAQQAKLNEHVSKYPDAYAF